MAMPETAVNEYDGMITGQYDIGVSGQIPGMKPEAESMTVEQAADEHLGFCVASPDA